MSPVEPGRDELGDGAVEAMDAPAEREWQNAEEDDFDRREARESERDAYSDERDRYYDRPRERDYDHPRGYDRPRERERARDAYVPPSRRDPPPSAQHARPSPPPSNILGAFGLSIRTTERDLEEEFARAGEVEKVVIVYDARTGRSRGFGFITMRDVDTASRAIEQMNGLELHGRKIRVDYSSTTRAHDPTPGEYRGNPRPVESRPPRRDAPGGGGSFRSGGRGFDYGRDSWRDRGRGGDSWRDRGRGRDRDRDRDYDRRAYDDYAPPPRAAGRWSSRRDDRDRDAPPAPRYRPGHGPDADDWRRRASPPPRRMRSRSPPRYRDYDDDRREAGRERDEDMPDDRHASRYTDEPTRRYE